MKTTVTKFYSYSGKVSEDINGNIKFRNSVKLLKEILEYIGAENVINVLQDPNDKMELLIIHKVRPLPRAADGAYWSCKKCFAVTEKNLQNCWTCGASRR